MLAMPSDKISIQVALLVSRLSENDSDAPQQLIKEASELSSKAACQLAFILFHKSSPERRQETLAAFRELSPKMIITAIESNLDPNILDFIARVKIDDAAIVRALSNSSNIEEPTAFYLARFSPIKSLTEIAASAGTIKKFPLIIDYILANPSTDKTIFKKIGIDVEDDETDEPEEEEHLSKYEQALRMKISQKIKMGITGDKEWRSLLLKESNKLIQNAVMKNPRITIGEIVEVSRNKQASEDMIRAIMLNKDWLKHPEVQRGLVVHPRTPLPKALRLMSILTAKELKQLAKSKTVAQAIAIQAKRMISE